MNKSIAKVNQLKVTFIIYSTTGDSLNLGTFDSPFLKVQQAADLMQSGIKALKLSCPGP